VGGVLRWQPWRVVDEFQHWLMAIKSQIGMCLKSNPRAAPAMLDRARARFKAANGGEHKDLCVAFELAVVSIATEPPNLRRHV